MATDPQPLSLEDQCLLHLICYLEEYPPEALASLSIPIRRRLLPYLPAADICLLENVGAGAGIDMELDVWKDVYRKRINVWKEVYVEENAQSILLQETIGGFRQRYIDFTYEQLLHVRPDLASCLLFSVPGYLSVDSWGEVEYPFCVPTNRCTPIRHRTLFSGERLLVHLMNVMVNICKCFPVNVGIYVSSFSAVGLWYNRSVVFSNFLKKILSKTRRVGLYTNYFCDEEPLFSVPHYILELIFSQREVFLSTLTLKGTNSFIRTAVSYACLFFSSPSSFSEDHRFLRSLYPHSSPSVPYGQLTSIEIINIETDLSVLQDDFDMVYRDLSLILSYQFSLRSVSLQFPNDDDVPTLVLLEALGSLLLQPQLLSLKLAWVTVGWKELDLLLSKFLASRTASQDQTKTLHFEVLTPEDTPEMTDYCVMGCSDLSCKILAFPQLISVGFDDILKHLSHFPCGSLKSLTLTCEEEPEEPASAMSLFAGDAQVLLERLEFEWMSLAVPPHPEVPFKNLFRSPNLKVVSLCNCRIGEDGILPALTQGLQQTAGRLEELYLDGNELGDSSHAELRRFGNALFKMNTLSKLVFSIRNNELGPWQFFSLHASWKRNVGDPNLRMKELLVSGNDYDGYTAELEEVAESGDFMADSCED